MRLGNRREWASGKWARCGSATDVCGSAVTEPDAARPESAAVTDVAVARSAAREAMVPGDRTTPTRLTDKFVDADVDRLARLVRDAVVGHFAFVVNGQPRVMPIAIVADGSSILLHGSTGSYWLRALAAGIPVALSITAVDGLVVARSAFESSMLYRSAVIFGSCTVVEKAAKATILDRMTEGLIPGRAAEVRPHAPKELAATLMLRMSIDDWTLKVSDGWPEDEASDVAGDAWAGILPLKSRYTAALAAPDLRDGIPVPPSVRVLLGG